MRPRYTVRFPVKKLNLARNLLGGEIYRHCYLERLPSGAMMVDHEGKMVGVFPSEDLAVAFRVAMEIVDGPV